MEKIVSLAKRRGFIFPSSEIYGGIASGYDYGPLGVELKNNLKRLWWSTMVQEREDVVGLDAAIIMHPKVWEASGHVESFTDPLVDCKSCKRRFRADHIVLADGSAKPEWQKKQPRSKKERAGARCPECGGELTPVRRFNLMMETRLGPVEDEASRAFLRPEITQGVHVNFENVRNVTRRKLPFGVAQIGKAFRNEITPGDFVFRMREFEQAELQYYVKPKDAERWFRYWKEERLKWYVERLGMTKEHLRFREHAEDELAHYARQALDIEYRFPSGWKELEGIHNRGDWDLRRHAEFSGKDLSVSDEGAKEKFIPYVVETSGGVDRSLLAVLLDAYEEVKGGRTTTTEATKEVEVVLHVARELAPVKVAVLPLSRKESLVQMARSLARDLRRHWVVEYDEVASIGRRYRRQDEIGTPYAVTVDFASLEDKKVTVRDRDTMKQDRISIHELTHYLQEKLPIP